MVSTCEHVTAVLVLDFGDSNMAAVYVRFSDYVCVIVIVLWSFIILRMCMYYVLVVVVSVATVLDVQLW